jgi:hypothetical protein
MTIVLQAQVKTWRGLEFGMTPAEATKILEEPLSPAENISEDYFAFYLSTIKIDFIEGKAKLLFSPKTHRLTKVDLLFSSGDIPGHGCMENKDSLAQYKMQFLDEKLAARYGKPIHEEGRLPTLAEWSHMIVYQETGKPSDFKRIWKSDGQVITEDTGWPCGVVFITISYTPEDKGL